MDYKQTPRPNKEKLTRAFFSQCSRPAAHYICLPSTHCYDVKIGIEAGVITPQTHITAIEKNSDIVPSIKGVLRGLKLKHTVITKEIQFAYIDKPIDCGYLDLCGQISPEFLLWLMNLNFTSSLQLAFTFSNSARCPSSSMSLWSQICNDQYRAVPHAKLIRTGGIHDNNERLNLAAGILSAFLPHTFRFNISKAYRDTSATMLFLGGYTGKTGHIHYSSKRKPSQTPIQDLEHRIKKLYKKVVRHQQIGGFKTSWNRLTAQQQRRLKSKFPRQLKYLGV